jgi:hypothetical protein
MEESKTAEELKQYRINVMGNDLGLLFDSLYNEIVWIHYRWIEYHELFGEKETRIDIMNKTAPFFFFMIQKVLWEDLLLGVSRITDKEKVAGRRNVTILAIPNYLNDVKFKVEVENKIQEIIKESDFCRDWRNRRISHKDHGLSIDNENTTPLKPSSRLKFKNVLEKIHELVHLIEKRYFNSETGFKYLTSDRGSVHLLQFLEDGLNYNNDRLEQRKRGQPNEPKKPSLV